MCTGWGQLLNVERSQLLNTGTDKTEQRPSEPSERSRVGPGSPATAQHGQQKNPRQVNSSISRCTVRASSLLAAMQQSPSTPPMPWSSNTIIVGTRQLVIEIRLASFSTLLFSTTLDSFKVLFRACSLKVLFRAWLLTDF